ncbi:MAG: ABC-F family ATP-binding cassette domain-containing protein, partial [Proteocatella sp.]
MNLYQIDKLYKTYGDKKLFEDVSLSIEHDDKIGVIGINGAGKTTLLNIIAEKDSADNIETIKSGKIAIEYLSQNPDIQEDLTVLEQIFKSESPVVMLVGRYEEILTKLEKNPDDEKLQQEMLVITQHMDSQNAWALESEAKKILTKLKIVEFDKKMKELSGGQRKRVALAGALIRPSDILILDEPTNHIDNDTIDFLEDHLKSIRTGLIMVTHDRYFLDRVTNTIVELENGKLHKYKGNYSKYLELKQQREQDQVKIEYKKQRLYKQELEWIRKGVEARRTKQKARKDRFEELEKEIDRSEKDNLDIDVASTRLGSKIIEAYNLSMSYGDKSLFEDFTYTINRTDRIGIIGNNGRGKSTLLNILARRIKPTSGTLEFGDTINIGYYTQENLDMDGNLRAIEYIRETAEYVTKKDGSKITASQMLENFLFTPTAQYTYIRNLSGGEKRRLYLLKILMG